MSNAASPKAPKASLMSKSENAEASRKQGLSHLLTYVKRRVEETYISVQQLTVEDVTPMDEFFDRLGTWMLDDLKKNKENDEPYKVGSILQFLSAAYTFFEESAAFKKEAMSAADYLKLWGNWTLGTAQQPPRPSWYFGFRDSVQRVYNENFITNEQGNVTGDADPERVLYAKELAKCCRTFLLNSTSSPNKHEERLLLLLLYHASGRGGELKHLMLTGRRGLRWDTKFKCLVVVWKETKVIRHYPLAIITDATSYTLCTVHAFAVFAAFNGFGRTNMEAVRSGFLFPSLQMKKNNSIASHVSNLLPKPHTSRCLRVSSATEMHVHPDTNEQDVNMRTGHASGHGNNTDKYFKPSTRTSLPGGMALARWPRVRHLVTPAALPEEVLRKLAKYTGAIFPFVTFSAFTDEKGSLAPVLEMLLASLLHRWDEMLGDELKTNNCNIMNHMVNAVMKVEDIDARTALSKLSEWSKTIDKNFIHSNALALGLGDKSGDLADFMKITSSIMSDLLSEMKTLKSELAAVKSSVKTVSTDVQVAALSPFKGGGAEPNKTVASSDITMSTMSGEQHMKKRKVGFKNEKNTKWPLVPAILEQIANEGRLSSMGSEAYNMQEQNKVKEAMAFVKGQITSEQFGVLKSKGVGESAESKLLSLKRTCEEVDAQVLAAMGKAFIDAGIQLGNRVKGGKWTILGVHQRLSELKKVEKSKEEEAAKKGKGLFSWGPGGNK